MRYCRKQLAVMGLALLILSTAAFGPPACNQTTQPRTVADILTAAGNTKRQLRSSGQIDAQTDYDISYRLAEANRSYRAFVTDELVRLDTTGTNAPDPNTRTAALRQLSTQLKALKDPGVLGIKSANARKIWSGAVEGVDTVITGIELLGGGN